MALARKDSSGGTGSQGHIGPEALDRGDEDEEFAAALAGPAGGSPIPVDYDAKTLSDIGIDVLTVRAHQDGDVTTVAARVHLGGGQPPQFRVVGLDGDGLPQLAWHLDMERDPAESDVWFGYTTLFEVVNRVILAPPAASQLSEPVFPSMCRAAPRAR